MGVIKTSNAARQLEQWGIWAWTGIPKLGAKSPNLQIVLDNMERPRRRAFHTITDDEGERIDAAVSALRRSQPKVGEAILQFYLYRRDGIEIAEAMGGTQRLALNRIDQGIMWIEGRLSGEEEEQAA